MAITLPLATWSKEWMWWTKSPAVRKGANDRPLTPVVIEKAVAVDEPNQPSREDSLIQNACGNWLLLPFLF
jgi:hypothetical protein